MKIALALIAAACVFGGAANGSTVKSGLYGKVTRGPITPVCVAEVPCSGPTAGATIVFSRAGREVSRTRTASDGTYRMALVPGTYSVRVLRYRPAEPATAWVPRGRFRHVDFSIDTGIR
jgi:hypothetical protein